MVSKRLSVPEKIELYAWVSELILKQFGELLEMSHPVIFCLQQLLQIIGSQSYSSALACSHPERYSNLCSPCDSFS